MRRALLAGLLAAGLPAVGAAQSVQDAPPPDTVAAEMRRAVRSMAWTALAQRLHPEALATFREHVTILVEHDRSEAMLERLLGGVDSAGFRALPDQEVFTRVMGAMGREVPGLLNALVVRESDVIGSVPEGPDTAHVVYRILPGITGERSRLAVMTLARLDGRWKVLHADELEVIQTALRGIPP